MKSIREKIEQDFQKRQAAKQEKLRYEFLPEALEIVEKPASPVGHFIISITAIIVIFFIVWSVFGKMDEVVTARGKIVTVSGIQNVQTVNGGIIEKICVEEGEHVAAGQPIAYLDSAAQEITLQNTSDSLELMKFENELLELALKEQDISTYLQKEKNEGRIQIIHYVLAMQKEYETGKQELESSVEQAMTQVEIEKKALEALKEKEGYLLKQKEAASELIGVEQKNTEKLELAIAQKEKEVKDYQKLCEIGAVARIEVETREEELELLRKDYEIQTVRKAYESQENELQGYEVDNQIASAGKEYSSQESAVLLATERYEQVKSSLESLKAGYDIKLSALMHENEDRISTQEANQEIQTISVGEQVLVSPVDGIVKTLEVNTDGGVLTPAQIVATVVPDDSQMLAEVEILNQDIGYVLPGQESAIKMDTYNFQEYGKLEGVIVSVSPDAVWDERKGWIYKGKISIASKKFEKRNSDMEIGAGMEGTAEIKVDERRIIDFFLEPIVEHFDGSLKVR